jgi:3-mercaptopyruvate sulfurtransferase SseA
MFAKLSIFLIFLLLVSTACSAPPAQAVPTLALTQVVEPPSTPSAGNLPSTEAEVPRVSLEDARAAIESGAAIVVDVRSDAAYEVSHIPGAINIPLGEIESNPTILKLDKEQWIITYCT